MAPNCYIPLELITDVLLRLPVKSILQFLLVCKQWYAIITSAGFIHDHFNHKSNRVNLLYRSAGPYMYNPQRLSFFADKTLERYEVPGYRHLSGTIVGSCNGVFCVTNLHHKLALWNPTTGKMRPLPGPSRRLGTIGFGVDPYTDEFKIVSVQRLNMVSIYTSSNGSWRNLEDNDILRDSCLPTTEWQNTFSKGFFYWRKYNKRTSTSVLLAFDMRNEVFQDVELPDDVRNEPMGSDYNPVRCQLVFGTMDDSLVMFSYARITWGEEDRVINEFEKNRVDIWVMKEPGCWIKTITLRLPFTFRRPLGIWKEKHILFSKWDDWVGRYAELVMYDPDSGNTRSLRIPPGDNTKVLWVFAYKESLFSVKGRNEIQDYGPESIVSREFFSQQHY